MSNWALILLAVLGLGAGISILSVLGFTDWASAEPVDQPIAFNHKVHATGDVDLKCIDCHTGVESQARAGLPSTSGCKLCHDDDPPETLKDPETWNKVREYITEGKEIPWIKVNRVIGHVYFSHARHVKLAEMKCEECHDKMAEMTEPIRESQVAHLDMDACMDCHDERGANNDCVACHK